MENVNHPKHYNLSSSGYEAIEIAELATFNLGNAIKYLWRTGLKDKNKELEDLKKALWYINREIKYITEVKNIFIVSGNSYKVEKINSDSVKIIASFENKAIKFVLTKLLDVLYIYNCTKLKYNRAIIVLNNLNDAAIYLHEEIDGRFQNIDK